MIFHVARKKSKTEMLTVKVAKVTYAEFQAACELRGISMSGLFHLYMVQTIREERDTSPGLFAQTLARIYRHKYEEKGLAALNEDIHDTGSTVQPIDHPEEIRNLEDLKKATRRTARPSQPRRKTKSA
jgi:hypothetical protein